MFSKPMQCLASLNRMTITILVLPGAWCIMPTTALIQSISSRREEPPWHRSNSQSIGHSRTSLCLSSGTAGKGKHLRTSVQPGHDVGRQAKGTHSLRGGCTLPRNPGIWQHQVLPRSVGIRLPKRPTTTTSVSWDTKKRT